MLSGSICGPRSSGWKGYLIFSRFNPTCDKWIPSKISGVNVQDSGPGHCGWGGSSQIGNLKHLLNKLLCKFFFHQMDQN